MKNYLLSAILFLFPAFTFAQMQLPPYVTLPMPGGYLMHMETYCIEEDRFGKKYVGTDYGINIYDGSTWINYGYPATFNTCCVYAIAFDSNDNTWIGTNAGVYKKDTNNIWSTFTVPFSACSQISIDHQGNKWFMGYTLTGGSNFLYELAKFDGTNWVRYDSTNTPAFINQRYKMLMDQNDIIWLLGETDGIILKFDGTNWTTYSSTDFGMPGSKAWAFTFDQGGIMWIVLSDNLDQYLLRFDGNTFTTMPDSNMFFMPSSYANSITVDAWGNKWITSDFGMMFKYDGSDWTYYMDTVGYGFGCIKAFGENIWMASSDIAPQDTNIYILNERGCNQIKGSVYLDANADNIFQPSEQIIPNLMMHLMPQNLYMYSNNPEYAFNLIDSLGSYTVEVMSPSNWINGGIQNINQTYFGEITDSVDFGIHALSNSDDVSISLINGRFRPGFNNVSWISYNSNSAHPLSDTITLIKDPLLTYINSSPSPIFQNGDTLKWYYSNLLPFENRTIIINFLVPSSVPLGTTVTMHSEIHPIATDTFPTDNFSNIQDSIRGSYDPNSKEVNLEGAVLPTERLEYTIRFQNTGTDTAFTVVLRDTISTWLDISTLEILGSSHPVNYQLSGRALIFTFSSINLQDSFANESMSHGFVKYSIKPVAGIPQGTTIDNVAAIYFDYNLPVITNSTTNSIDYFLSADHDNTAGYFEIYPNPASGKIKLSAANSKRFEIYNALGKIVLEGNTENNKNFFEVDIHDLQSGVYFIKIEFLKNFVVGKFIKQ